MSPTVLLVDDSRIARMAMRKLFTDSRPDLRFLEAGHAGEAEGVMAAETVDLLCIDYNMPGENGLEVAARVRQARPELPIFLVTANVQDAIQQRASDLGVTFVAKPFNADSARRILSAIPQ